MFRILLFCLLCTTTTTAQNYYRGNLPIINYTKKDYQGGTQTWDAQVAPNGLMYFANNEGLLEFDGVHWRKYPLSNRTIVRSLAVKDEKIYVGGQGELGCFVPSPNGSLTYRSLTELIPEEYRNFADVWDILILDDRIFFRTERYLFVYQNQSIKAFITGGAIQYIGLINGNVYVHDEYKGLLRFADDSFLLSDFSHKPPSPVTAFLPYRRDTFLIATLNDGFYLFDEQDLTPFSAPFDKITAGKSIYTGLVLPDNSYALSVTGAGLYLTDRNLQITRSLSRDEGLQNTNILTAAPDATGNLWLGTDNGIDYAEINSAFTSLYPDGNLEGTGYTVEIFNNRLYLGNSNGLYVSKSREDTHKKGAFQPVGGASGQVWGLHRSGGQLFLGHHNGAFIIEGNRAVPLATGQGYWKFLRLDDKHLAAGHYNGISIFRQENGRWVKVHEVKNLSESSRLLVKENDRTLWMAHPYRGIFRIELREDYTTLNVKKYGAADGLPSDNLNHVFKIRNEVIFAGETGVFRFDKETENFTALESYGKISKPYGRVKMLKEAPNGDVWFMAGATVGRLKVKDDGLEIEVQEEVFPELSNRLTGGFEFVYPVAEDQIYFGAEKGFIRFDAQKYAASKFDLQVYLREMRLSGDTDSLLYAGTGAAATLGDEFELAHRENTLQFTFGAADYRNPEELRFQTKLAGLSDKWSDWSEKSEKEYTGLRHGDYVFSVRARNATGVVSEAKSASFTVNPPWYLTAWAYGFYALSVGILIVFGLRRQSRIYEKQKDSLVSRHEAQERIIMERVEAGELELNRIKRQKLEAEVAYKSQELASTTLNLVQKREFLGKLKTDLEKVIGKIKDKTARPQDLQKIIRTLERDLESDNEWERFAHHFDGVHQGFLTRLKEKHPALSPNDLKLAAYLRMNLSSKEIAPLTGISVRGVEAGRYRLRKKMALRGEDDLREIMMGI